MKPAFRRVLLLASHAALTLAFVFGCAFAADAACRPTVGTADMAAWKAHHGCDIMFALWQFSAYNMTGEWHGQGLLNACDLRFEYTKTWNASSLVTFGLADDPAHEFHGRTDYRQLAESRDTDFKDSLYYGLTDANVNAQYIHHWPGDDEIQLGCLLFEPASASANPASRGADFMHEGWHGWLTEHDWTNGSCSGHFCGPRGHCPKQSCDFFYFHALRAYRFGDLYQTDGTQNRFHSPNQVQVEFLCDIADAPNFWVPAAVTLAGAVDANWRANNRFINGPGFHCGDQRPF